MPRFLLPGQTARATAFSLWKDSAMPMVTLTKTFDVSALQGQPHVNACLVWAIGQAASRIPEFYLLPESDGFFAYERLAVNVIVKTESGGICDCLIPWKPDFTAFLQDYLRLTRRAATSGECPGIEGADDCMVIGTSALTVTELDSAVNACSPWPNPYLIWGRIRTDATLPVSFQFHHAQMDGYEAAAFLEALQQSIGSFGHLHTRQGSSII